MPPVGPTCLEMLEHTAAPCTRSAASPSSATRAPRSFALGARVLEETHRVSVALGRAGRGGGGARVVIMMNTQFAFLHAFFGCMGAGAPSPSRWLAPRDDHPEPLGSLQSLGRFARRVQASIVLYDRSLPVELRPHDGPIQAFTLGHGRANPGGKESRLGTHALHLGQHRTEIAYIQPTAGRDGACARRGADAPQHPLEYPRCGRSTQGAACRMWGYHGCRLTTS